MCLSVGGYRPGGTVGIVAAGLAGVHLVFGIRREALLGAVGADDVGAGQSLTEMIVDGRPQLGLQAAKLARSANVEALGYK